MAQLGSVGVNARDVYRGVGGSSWLDRLTRLGFLAKGIVYLLIGTLALLAAFQEGGETTDQTGIIHKIATKPFGEFLLFAIGIGLLAYAAWRFLCAFVDSENKGDGKEGMAKRAGYFGSGVIHASLAIAALKLAIGSPSASGSSAQSWSAKVLDAPGGMFIMAALGVAIIIGGIEQFRHGMNRKFEKELRMDQMNAQERETVSKAGKWGYAARGITFVLSGAFVVFAAIQHDPSRVKGLEGALDMIASQPFGPILMALVAAGLVGYGVYCMFAAKYRKLRFA